VDSDVFRPDIDHLDGVTMHYGVTNLEYVTRKENTVRGHVVRVRLQNAGFSTGPIRYLCPTCGCFFFGGTVGLFVQACR
jgi:hypothetical protein